MKKQQLIQDELHLVRAEMEFVRKYPLSEQPKVSIVPCQEIGQTKASPEKTASGKDNSNPLLAVALPKSKSEVQTSTTLVKPSDLNLRPNGGIQAPVKSESQFSASLNRLTRSKSYYVVYNGPNPGIYTTWELAEKATKGISDIKYKRFKTFEEAKVSANIFTTSQYKAPLELICSSEGLRPSYKGVLTKVKDPKTILGTLPKIQQKELLDDETNIYETSTTGFNYLYKLGREATEATFVEEHYFTTDKKNISYFNFYPNSHPEFILEAYLYGLLAMIYPSDNLLEISKFPTSFREAIKTYKKKCLKGQEKDIYLKFTGTVIFWDKEDEPIQPYYYVQIGIIKTKIYNPSQAVRVSLKKEDLFALAEQKLLVLIDRVFSITKDDKIKINLATSNCLVTSYSHKGISEDDYSKIKAFRKQLISPNVFGFHYPTTCKKVAGLIEKKGILHSCTICNNSADPSSSTTNSVEKMEDPTTTPKASPKDKGKAIMESVEKIEKASSTDSE